MSEPSESGQDRRRPEIPEHLRGALGGPSDSAGVPWGGRELHSNPFAGDSGEADPALRQALTDVSTAPLEPHRHRAVLTALTAVRLYAPVLPSILEQSVDERGLIHDNASEMAMVRLQAADGREATPAFTDIPSLTAWHPQARPVPIEAERLGAAAVEEGAQLVVIDPGTPHMFLLRRPALWSFLQRRAWMPSWADAQVASALQALASPLDWVDGVRMGPGSGTVHAEGPEVRIELQVARRPEPDEIGALQNRLAADATIADRIDSLALGFSSP